MSSHDDHDQQPSPHDESASPVLGVPHGGARSSLGGASSEACARASSLAANPDDMTFLVDAMPFVSVGVDGRTRTLAIVLSDGPAASLSPDTEHKDVDARYPAILLTERSAIHFIRSAQEALQHLSRLPLSPK